MLPGSAAAGGGRGLYRLGATANQVTAGAAAVSLLVAAWVFWRAPAQPLWYALLPAWMLLRMGLNAIDGMLAREFGQQSRLGAYLNELSDVIADAALYLSLASVPGVGAGWLWALALAAASTEYAGVLGLMVGAGRRYDGPMGKSDCAFAIGLLGLLLAGGWVGAKTVDGFAMVLAVLCAATVLRRVAAGLREAAQRRRDPIECLCEAVDGGGSLILFPEGTRNTEEGVLPFKSGIYHLARHRPELEFVPVWIDNLKRVMPKGKWLPLPLLCTTTFGEPLRLGASEDKHAFLERTRAALLALSPEQMEAAWLFLGIAAVLLLATLMSETLRWRPSAVLDNLVARIRAWWVMAAVVALAFVFGRIGVIVLFALVSLFALREFITLAPTRRGDYYALLAAFYIVLPWQYWLVWSGWYGLYTVLIQVYAFLVLPILATIGRDTTRSLERTAKVQWGLMICVKDWGYMIEGHGGVLDRLHSVCFAAPVFFHLIRYGWV